MQCRLRVINATANALQLHSSDKFYVVEGKMSSCTTSIALFVQLALLANIIIEIGVWTFRNCLLPCAHKCSKLQAFRNKY